MSGRLFHMRTPFAVAVMLLVSVPAACGDGSTTVQSGDDATTTTATEDDPSILLKEHAGHWRVPAGLTVSRALEHDGNGLFEAEFSWRSKPTLSVVDDFVRQLVALNFIAEGIGVVDGKVAGCVGGTGFASDGTGTCRLLSERGGDGGSVHLLFTATSPTSGKVAFTRDFLSPMRMPK